MANDNNEKIELAVFREFAQVCPLLLLADTAENRNPPEPDILCGLSTGDKLAFELVSVEDAVSENDSVLKVDNDYRELTIALKDAYKAALAENRVTNPARFKFQSVNVIFQDGASIGQRRKAIPCVVELLNKLGPGRHEVREKVIRLICCEPFSDPGKYAGPILHAGSTSCTVGNSTVENIKTKIEKKNYDTDHPIHLLAWSERASAEELNLLEADKELATLLTGGGVQFARVWVYGRGKKAIVFDSGSVLIADK